MVLTCSYVDVFRCSAVPFRIERMEFNGGFLDVYVAGRSAPIVLLIAGVNNFERCSTAIALELVEILRSKKLTGTVIVIPSLHTLSTIEAASVDYCEVFRLGRLAEVVQTALTRYLDVSDYVIEIRCKRNAVTYIETPKDYLDFVKDIAIAELVAPMGTCSEESIACRLNASKKIILLWTSGLIDMAPNQFEHSLNSVMLLLEKLGVLRQRRSGESGSKHVTICREVIHVKSDASGVFVPLKSPGDVVKLGEPLGKIGEKNVTSPSSGVLLAILGVTPIAKNCAVGLLCVTDQGYRL